MITYEFAINTSKYIFVLIATLLLAGCSFNNITSYEAILQPDGGYAVKIKLDKTYTVSADGLFSKNIYHYEIRLIGKGKDWSYKKQNGYYYSQNEITGIKTGAWDFGYAWVDHDRSCIHLNLYWVSSPNGMTPSDINGRYCLTGGKQEHPPR